jgi:hypothetical protein
MKPQGGADTTYLDEVDLGECLVAAGFLDIKDRDDVLMVEVP